MTIHQIKQVRDRGFLLEATVTGNYKHLGELKNEIVEKLKWPFLKSEDFYLECKGRILREDDLRMSGEVVRRIYVVPRVNGGKGGFGSMLRAIGAQIEKTTNREACRDLSGRRLRDINEEQRLKKWFALQKEREEERKERKLRKLDKLRQISEGPRLAKIEDQGFLQQREEIVEAVFDAVDEGSSRQQATSQTMKIPENVSITENIETGSGSIKGRKSVKRTMFDEQLETDSSENEGDDGIEKEDDRDDDDDDDTLEGPVLDEGMPSASKKAKLS